MVTYATLPGTSLTKQRFKRRSPQCSPSFGVTQALFEQSAVSVLQHSLHAHDVQDVAEAAPLELEQVDQPNICGGANDVLLAEVLIFQDLVARDAPELGLWASFSNFTKPLKQESEPLRASCFWTIWALGQSAAW